MYSRQVKTFLCCWCAVSAFDMHVVEYLHILAILFAVQFSLGAEHSSVTGQSWPIPPPLAHWPVLALMIVWVTDKTLRMRANFAHNPIVFAVAIAIAYQLWQSMQPGWWENRVGVVFMLVCCALGVAQLASALLINVPQKRVSVMQV